MAGYSTVFDAFFNESPGTPKVVLRLDVLHSLPNTVVVQQLVVALPQLVQFALQHARLPVSPESLGFQVVLLSVSLEVSGMRNMLRYNIV